MSDQDTLPNKQKPQQTGQQAGQTGKKKFLFDQHNFDEGPVSLEPEPEEPPPPSFSEEELARTGRDSYQKGFNEGKHESDTSRERYVVDLLENVEAQFATLFTAEQERNTRYENESVHLCRAIFKRAFPTLNESRGLQEITEIIHSVLESHRETPEIIIEVDPDFVDPIEKKLKKLMNSEGFTGNFTVKGNASCRVGDCRMSWKDGGAQRNAAQLSEKILKQLEDTLAEKPLLHNNGQKDIGTVAMEDDSTPQESTPPTDQEMEHEE